MCNDRQLQLLLLESFADSGQHYGYVCFEIWKEEGVGFFFFSFLIENPRHGTCYIWCILCMLVFHYNPHAQSFVLKSEAVFVGDLR